MLRGSGEAECRRDGRWAPPVPACVPGEQGQRASVQPRTAARASLWQQLGNGEKDVPRQGRPTVKYTCRPGYARHPQMPPMITCLKNQTWSDAQEFCKRKRCEHPGEPRNGRVIVTTDLLFGSTVNYTCEEGYRLTGHAQRRCVISGSGKRVVWSGDPPCTRSTAIVCDPPPDIPHGRHTGRLMDDFPYAAVVTYTCDPGYPLTGEDFIFCTTEDGVHGVWSGPPPRCGGRTLPSAGPLVPVGPSLTRAAQVRFSVLPPLPRARLAAWVSVPRTPGTGAGKTSETHRIWGGGNSNST
uniref:Sushi domain-containing protein n=1 Tax=Dromaius novaehollandiae TaxID=8790 RepID=A0A8C4K1W9_DRONO